MAQEPEQGRKHLKEAGRRLEQVELALRGLIRTLQRRHDLPELGGLLFELDRRGQKPVGGLLFLEKENPIQKGVADARVSGK